ncbi:MAG: JAB domain-containing protein [bacterium]
MKRNEFFLGFCMQPAPSVTDVYVRTPEDCYRACEEQAGYGQEAFTVLCLNTRNRLIAGGIISIGVIDATLVHAREVFRKAIEIRASAVVLIHNHPSGETTPSAEDIRLTKQLVQAGQVIGIKVLDHVIIGTRRPEYLRPYTSIRENGLVEFDT